VAFQRSAGAKDDFAVGMSDLFDEPASKPATKHDMGLFQETNVEAFIEEYDWLQVATKVAEEARFVHYDLIFADILKARGGFDLVVGNPPWARPSWNEGQIISDIDPIYIGLSASRLRDELPTALNTQEKLMLFLKQYSSTRGSMEVTSSKIMNPFVGAGANNLYRCFIDLSFRLCANKGCVALIHQDGHLSDPKAGGLRTHWYSRIAKRFHFRNELKSRMFLEIGNNTEFSLNVYRGSPSKVNFDQVTSAFTSNQVDESYADHFGVGEIPAIKTIDGKWETRGHKGRIINIDEEALRTIHSLAEEDNVPFMETRFIQPFSRSTLAVFEQLATFDKLGNLGSSGSEKLNWQLSHDWNETTDTKVTRYIERATAFRSLEEMVIQGPLFYVGNPVYKSAKRKSKSHKDYDVVDIENIPVNYVARTNYGPAVTFTEYKRKMTKCQWDREKYHSDFFRLAVREMINLNGERSLISALIPPSLTHVHTINSMAFSSNRDLVNFAALAHSLVFDAYYKVSGRGHFQPEDAKRLVWKKMPDEALTRVIKLNCLTEAYNELWNELSATLSISAGWSQFFPNARDSDLNISTPWVFDSPLRSDLSRRLALLEIDVIVSISLGIELKQLLDLYRVFFPVLQNNDKNTWFDQRGQIVWTSSKGLIGVGYLNEKGKSPGRKEWESILESNPSELVCTAIDDTMPDGPEKVERRFVGPFFKCDRIEDYKRAWAHFEKLKQVGKL